MWVAISKEGVVLSALENQDSFLGINLSYDACNEHWYLIIQRISVTRAKTPIISLVRNSHNNSAWEFSLIPCLSCDLVGVIRNYLISKKSFHFVFFSVPARLLKLTVFLFQCFARCKNLIAPMSVFSTLFQQVSHIGPLLWQLFHKAASPSVITYF